jgi:hypothetical protein
VGKGCSKKLMPCSNNRDRILLRFNSKECRLRAGVNNLYIYLNKGFIKSC